MCATGGVKRVATTWLCMRKRKARNVGVSWDGCIRSIENNARIGVQNRKGSDSYSTEKNKEKKFKRRNGRA